MKMKNNEEQWRTKEQKYNVWLIVKATTTKLKLVFITSASKSWSLAPQFHLLLAHFKRFMCLFANGLGPMHFGPNLSELRPKNYSKVNNTYNLTCTAQLTFKMVELALGCMTFVAHWISFPTKQVWH